MGTMEPRAELSPMTRLFATETPRRSTLRPKQMAPKPHKKPNPRAAALACGDAVASTAIQSPADVPAIASGMTRHETTMKTNQTFSHFQRGMTFMGAVNKPLQIPERAARVMPVVSMFSSEYCRKMWMSIPVV